MRHSESIDLLHRKFNQVDPEISIDEAGLVIRNFLFHSEVSQLIRRSKQDGFDLKTPFLAVPDERIAVNNDFVYSVFLRKGDFRKHKRVIVMLHGLNERKWTKYLPWAAYLVEKTGIPVVLFPISFHMNRSPEEWSNPRFLSPIVKRQIMKGELDTSTTVINYALSQRLKEMPERFFLSGYQSITDVLRLTESWKSGQNPLFHPELKVDFFSYSIGAFLTEVLMIANPKSWFNDSRFFFFCGGSLFSGMNATSRFILNKTSFESIYRFYVKQFEREVVQKGHYQDILNESAFGKAFRAMLVPDRFRKERQETFRQFGENIKAIGLTQDRVVPPESIANTLSGIRSFEEMDFDFPYSHENPFDAKLTKYQSKINEGFEKVMDKACGFFS